jgi:hypothetical protein
MPFTAKKDAPATTTATTGHTFRLNIILKRFFTIFDQTQRKIPHQFRQQGQLTNVFWPRANDGRRQAFFLRGKNDALPHHKASQNARLFLNEQRAAIV